MPRWHDARRGENYRYLRTSTKASNDTPAAAVGGLTPPSGDENHHRRIDNVIYKPRQTRETSDVDAILTETDEEAERRGAEARAN